MTGRCPLTREDCTDKCAWWGHHGPVCDIVAAIYAMFSVPEPDETGPHDIPIRTTRRARRISG